MAGNTEEFKTLEEFQEALMDPITLDFFKEPLLWENFVYSKGVISEIANTTTYDKTKIRIHPIKATKYEEKELNEMLQSLQDPRLTNDQLIADIVKITNLLTTSGAPLGNIDDNNFKQIFSSIIPLIASQPGYQFKKPDQTLNSILIGLNCEENFDKLTGYKACTEKDKENIKLELQETLKTLFTRNNQTEEQFKEFLYSNGLASAASPLKIEKPPATFNDAKLVTTPIQSVDEDTELDKLFKLCPQKKEDDIKSKMKLLLDTCPQLLNKQGKHTGNTIVMELTRHNKPEVLKFLIENYKDTINCDIPNNANNTPLIMAAGSGDAVMVEMLLEAGADVSHKGAQNLSALERAASVRDPDKRAAVIQLLQDKLKSELAPITPRRGRR